MSLVNIYHKTPLSIDLIKDTFESSFNKVFDKDNWEWRFLNNPNSNKTYIAYIIEDGVLAAYYAVSPMLISMNGTSKKVALSNMTMTHPNYRGKGYFKMLAKALFDDLKKDDFIAVFGFANHNSHYGFRKYLNWKDLSVLSLFKVVPKDFKAIKTENNLVTFTTESITTTLVQNIERLQVAQNDKTVIKRTIEILDWRLKNNPTNNYKVQVGRLNNKIVSLFFYKNFNDEIDMMEFFYDYDSKIKNLLILNISHIITEFNASINLWSNLHSEEHINLEKQGFKETEFNTYLGIIPLIENEKILDYKNWHYRFIDSDIY